MFLRNNFTKNFKKCPYFDGSKFFVSILFYVIVLEQTKHALFNSLEGLFRHHHREPETNAPNISSECLTYRDKEMEKLYINQRDYLFKYSMLLAYCIACLLVILQFDSHTSVCYLCTAINTVVIVSFGILSFIAWYKKMCFTVNQIKSRDNPTYNRFSCFMFHLVTEIQNTVEIRVGIYLFITLSHGTIIALIMVSTEKIYGRSGTTNPHKVL